MATHDLPEMYPLEATHVALWDISGKLLVVVLQLLASYMCKQSLKEY